MGLEVKSVFKKYARCERIAEADGILVGKCGELVFIIVKDKDLDLNLEFLYSINVELTKLESGKKFKYGRYESYSYIATTEILLNEIKARAEHLSERESKIVRELTILSEEAKTLSAKNLKKVSFFYLHCSRRLLSFTRMCSQSS